MYMYVNVVCIVYKCTCTCKHNMCVYMPVHVLCVPGGYTDNWQHTCIYTQITLYMYIQCTCTLYLVIGSISIHVINWTAVNTFHMYMYVHTCTLPEYILYTNQGTHTYIAISAESLQLEKLMVAMAMAELQNCRSCGPTFWPWIPFLSAEREGEREREGGRERREREGGRERDYMYMYM